MTESMFSLSVRINGGRFMRKAVLFAIFIGVSIGLLTTSNASAQSLSIYAVKFVCGKQAPINSLTPPAEPPVKPGNYATKVNVELLSPPNANGGGSGVSWNVSLAGGGGPSLTTLANPLSQLETVDVTCAAIAKQSGSAAKLPAFIEGYVNVIASPGVQLAVTAVYTSQGCTFPPGVATIAVLPSVCSGPVSIDVVPQQSVPFTPPAAP
jgi:hypothetical protein